MNYKETTATGTMYQRCRAVTIQNPHTNATFGGQSATPAAYFQEETVMIFPGDKYVFSDAGSCMKAFDPATEFPLLDPESGEPTGTMISHGYLYAILYSLYLNTAQERDVAIT